MSYEMLIKETETLTYEEQINLMAYLANTIQERIRKSKEEKCQQQLKALSSLSGLFSEEEMAAVDESISNGIKLKEISYINCLGMAAGELKHGTISLIENGTFVLALAMYEKLNDKMLSNIKEVKARGANVLVVTFKGNNTFLGAADDIIYLPKTHPLLTPSLAVIPLQIFSYYISLFGGPDMDKTRLLPRSATVE